MRKRIAPVVEDNPPERDMIAGWLRLEGLQVETAVDYRAAVAALASIRPDIICCDISLPRESGLDLVEHVRSNQATEWIPIRGMSEGHPPEEMGKAEQVGAHAYLKKPFSRDRLEKYVTALL